MAIRGPCGSGCHCAGGGGGTHPCSPVALPQTNLTLTTRVGAGLLQVTYPLTYSAPGGVDQWVYPCTSGVKASVSCAAGTVVFCVQSYSSSFCSGTAVQSDSSGGSCPANTINTWTLDSWTSSPFFIRWKIIQSGTTYYTTLTP